MDLSNWAYYLDINRLIENSKNSGMFINNRSKKLNKAIDIFFFSLFLIFAYFFYKIAIFCFLETYKFIKNFLIIFFFNSNRSFAEELKRKNIVVIDGGSSEKKDLLSYYIYEKSMGKGKNSSFFFGLSKKGRIFDLDRKIENSYDSLLSDESSNNKIVYELQDDHIPNQKKELENFPITISKQIYLKNDSTLFLCSFTKGKIWEEIKKISDYTVVCEETREAFFGTFLIFQIEIRNENSPFFYKRKKIVIRKFSSLYRRFKNNIIKSEIFENLLLV